MTTQVHAGTSSQMHHSLPLDRQTPGLRGPSDAGTSDGERVREAFTQFVGETFYAQMLKAMRTSLGKPAYFHGGRAEEVFTSQLDQTLAEQLADKSTETFIEPLFEHQFPAMAKQQAEQGSAEDASVAHDRTSLHALRRW